MNDRQLSDLLRRATEPRPLPEDLLRRLHEAVVDLDAEPAIAAGADGPRPLPPELRDRLLVTVGVTAAGSPPAAGSPAPPARLARFRPRNLPQALVVRMVAVAAAVLLIAGTAALATHQPDRRPAPLALAPTTTTTAPAVPEVTTTTTPPAEPQLAAPPAKGVLVAYDSCAALLGEIKAEATKRVEAGGLPGRWWGPVAAGTAGATASFEGEGDAVAAADSSPADRFSTTNIQEQGVDEADVVKTDGRQVFHVTHHPTGGRMLRRLRVGDGAPEVTAAVPLDWDAQELFLVGERAVLLGNRHLEGASYAVLWVLDVSGAEMRLLWSQETEGWYRTARLVDGEVRMVVVSAETPEWVRPADGSEGARAQARQANQRLAQRSRLEDWVPRTVAVDYRGRTPKRSETSACSCEQTRRASGEFTGFEQVTVHSVAVGDPKLGEAAGVRGAADTVYASRSNLYVATQEFSSTWTGSTAPTRVHQFELAAGGGARYAATGTVRGSAYGQFALSEHQGHLRVATTEWRSADGVPSATESFVTVLRRSAAELVEVGRLGGLGKDGERIHSTRFLGDRAYVVTFRQTDPLYVLDLADPARPRKVGELEIPGVSTYLHPLDGNRLVGVGMGPSEEGGTGWGLQVALFDVGDPANPKRTAVKTVPGLRAATDHRAFLYWQPTGSIILPASGSEATSDGEPRWFSGAVAFGERAGLAEQWRVSHRDRGNSAPYHPIERLVVVGDRVLSFSPVGVLASRLSDGADIAWRAY